MRALLFPLFICWIVSGISASLIDLPSDISVLNEGADTELNDQDPLSIFQQPMPGSDEVQPELISLKARPGRGRPQSRPAPFFIAVMAARNRRTTKAPRRTRRRTTRRGITATTRKTTTRVRLPSQWPCVEWQLGGPCEQEARWPIQNVEKEKFPIITTTTGLTADAVLEANFNDDSKFDDSAKDPIANGSKTTSRSTTQKPSKTTTETTKTTQASDFKDPTVDMVNQGFNMWGSVNPWPWFQQNRGHSKLRIEGIE